MKVRMTEAKDWALLKRVRLAALANTPTAFGVSYDTAAQYTDEQWQERASAKAGPEFWLAFMDGEPVGMIGAGISQTQRYNLIGMWVEPGVRGSGIASSLVEAVKSRALQKGHGRVFLDVSPDNERAARFYLKHGFVFIDEYEPLASHPHITVQTMVWNANDSKFQGACHCGAVRFQVRLTDGLKTARRCNCSYCRMRGAVAVSAALQDIEITSGAELLTLYQFNTMQAKHYFCSKCGIYTHHQRRSNPEQYGVNAACLEGISPFDFAELPVNEGRTHPKDKGAGGGPEVAGYLRYFPNTAR